MNVFYTIMVFNVFVGILSVILLVSGCNLRCSGILNNDQLVANSHPDNHNNGSLEVSYIVLVNVRTTLVQYFCTSWFSTILRILILFLFSLLECFYHTPS